MLVQDGRRPFLHDPHVLTLAGAFCMPPRLAWVADLAVLSHASMSYLAGNRLLTLKTCPPGNAGPLSEKRRCPCLCVSGLREGESLQMTALSPNDVVILFAHDARKYLHVDGLHLKPRCCAPGSSRLPSTLDEHSFILRRAARHAAAADVTPFQPRELATLQHVASGQFLTDRAGVVALQPFAGAGTSWEIGRALAAMASAPLQVGELVHIRSEAGLLHLSSGSSDNAVVHCSTTHAVRWRLQRVAPAAARMQQLRLGDLVSFSLPGGAAGSVASRVAQDDEYGLVRFLRAGDEPVPVGMSGEVTGGPTPHATAVWQLVPALEGGQPPNDAPPLIAGHTQFQLCHVLNGAALGAFELPAASQKPSASAGRSGVLALVKSGGASPSSSAYEGGSAPTTQLPPTDAAALVDGSDGGVGVSLHVAAGGSDGFGDGGGFHLQLALGASLPATTAVDDGSHVAIRVHRVSTGPAWLSTSNVAMASPLGGASPNDRAWSDPIVWSELAAAAQSGHATSPPTASPLVVCIHRLGDADARAVRFLATARRHLLEHISAIRTSPAAEASPYSVSTSMSDAVKEHAALANTVLDGLIGFAVTLARRKRVHEAAIPALVTELLRVASAHRRDDSTWPLEMHALCAGCYAVLVAIARACVPTAAVLCREVDMFAAHVGLGLGASELLSSILTAAPEALAAVPNPTALARTLVASLQAGAKRHVVLKLLAAMCGADGASAAGAAGAFWLGAHQAAVAGVLAAAGEDLLVRVVWGTGPRSGQLLAAPPPSPPLSPPEGAPTPAVAPEDAVPLPTPSRVPPRTPLPTHLASTMQTTPQWTPLSTPARQKRKPTASSRRAPPPQPTQPEDAPPPQPTLPEAAAVEAADAPPGKDEHEAEEAVTESPAAESSMTEPLAAPGSPEAAVAAESTDVAPSAALMDAAEPISAPEELMVPTPDGDARRLCAQWRTPSNGDTTVSADALYGTPLPLLQEVAAPLRVLAASEGAAALLLTADGGADVDEEVSARANVSLALLASLDLLASICEGRASFADSSPTREMLPSVDLLLASASDPSVPPAVRGACVRLLTVAYVDVPPHALVKRPQPWRLWVDTEAIEPPPPIPALELKASVHALLVDQITRAAAQITIESEASLGQAELADASLSSSFGQQLPLVLPLLRLMELLVRAGHIRFAVDIEPLVPPLRRMLQACAGRAAPSAADGALPQRRSRYDAGRLDVAGDGDLHAEVHLWIPTLGGESRADVVRCARRACACLAAVVLLQQHLDMNSALVSLRRNRLSASPHGVQPPHGSPAAKRAAGSGTTPLQTLSNVRKLPKRSAAAMNAAVAAAEDAAAARWAHEQALGFDETLRAAHLALRIDRPTTVQPFARDDAPDIPQLLLPLLALEDDELTASTLHLVSAHGERRRAMLHLGAPLLLLHAPTSIALHAKVEALVRALEEASAARPRGKLADLPRAIAIETRFASAEWYLHVRYLLTELNAAMGSAVAPTAADTPAPLAAAIATYHLLNDSGKPAFVGKPDMAKRERRMRVLRALRPHVPVLALLDSLPGSHEDADENERSLARLACKALRPLMVSAGGGWSLALLEVSVAPLVRHAACSEAVDCMKALLHDDRELCAACPPHIVRSLLALPLAHGHHPSYLALVRTLINHEGIILDGPRAHVVSALKALPPHELQRLLPMATPVDGVIGASQFASVDGGDASSAYRVEAAELLCECAAGGSFDGEALCRRLCPLPSLISGIVGAASENTLRTSLLRLLMAAYVDAEVRSSALAESVGVHDLLEYVRERLHMATTAIKAAHSVAATISAGQTASAGAAALATAPDATFLATAALPFLQRFYQGVYRPLEASVRLREVSSAVATNLGSLVATLASPNAPGLAQILSAAQRAELHILRRSGRQLLLLLQRRGLATAISSESMQVLLLSPPATPRDAPSPTTTKPSPVQQLLGLDALTSPRAMRTPREHTPGGEDDAMGTAGAPTAGASLTLMTPRGARTSSASPESVVQVAAAAGAANVAAAEAEAAAETAALEEVEAEALGITEALVQQRWGDLMWELRQNVHVVRKVRADHEALLRSLRMPLSSLKAVPGHGSVESLLQLLVRHAARQLRSCASAPLGDTREYAALNAGGGHEDEDAIVGGASASTMLGYLGDSPPSGWLHLGGVLQLLCELAASERPEKMSTHVRALVDAGYMRLLVSLWLRADIPPDVLEPGLRLGVIALGLVNVAGPVSPAQTELLALLRPSDGGGGSGPGLHGLCDRMRDVGRVLGFVGANKYALDAGAEAIADEQAVAPASEAAARRCALLLIRLIETMCEGPHPATQTLLRGAAPIATPPSADAAAEGEGAASLREPASRPDVLAELCRWLLRFEVLPRPALLTIAAHAAHAIAALCDGPHTANVLAVCTSAVPLCAARLLVSRHEPTLYPPAEARQLRAALAALLTTLLSDEAEGLQVAQVITRQGGPLDATAIRMLLVGAHAVWRSAQGDEYAASSDKESGDVEPAAPSDRSWRALSELTQRAPILRRWSQPGYSRRQQEALAEGCGIYALTERLCELLPNLRDEIVPSHPSVSTAYSTVGTEAGAIASGRSVRQVAEALSFFHSRVGRVEIVGLRNGLTCTVYFGIPEDMALLPAMIRQRVAGTEPPADFISGSQSNVGWLHDSNAAAGRLPSLEPRHLVSFVQQCVVLYSQLDYLRSLSYYRGLIVLTSHLSALLLVQAVLSCLIGGALWRQPAAALPGATVERLAMPPFLLSAAHLGFSIGLAAIYIIRFGPTIISHAEGLAAASVAAATSADDDEDEYDAAMPSFAADPAAVAGGLATARSQRATAVMMSAAEDSKGGLGGGGSTRRRLTSVLLRLRVPVAVWLPLLQGYRSMRAEATAVREDVSLLALGTAAVPSERLRLRARPLHPLAPFAFFLLAARALLADGTMALLTLQLVCSALSLSSFPPLAAALPLLSAIACVQPLRALVAALVTATADLAQAAIAAALLATVGAAVAAHALPVACGDAGGPYECVDGVDCLLAVVEASTHATGLRGECARAASDAARTMANASAGGAAGASALPAFQIGLSLGVPTFLLAWTFAIIRGAIGTMPTRGFTTAPRERQRCFLTGSARDRRGGGDDEGIVREGDAAGADVLSGTKEHSPWHYCAFICRVLATPGFARSSIERHAARCLFDGGGVGWLPYAANSEVARPKDGVKEEGVRGRNAFMPLALAGRG